MTKKDALNILVQTINACDLSAFTADQQSKITDAIDTANNMVAQLSKTRATSDEAKAKANAKRADARAELIKTVAPVLRETLTHTQIGLTAKEIYDDAAANLPADFNWQRVQAVLLREMKDELDIIEAKGKANTYRLK